METNPNQNSFSEMLLYKTPNGEVKVEIYLQNETVWVTLQKMAELFGVAKSTISEHLKNIYNSGELQREATVRNFRTVQNEGNREVSRDLDYHNLDAIISVGYRVNSTQATAFRIWATDRLKEYIIKGFTMDDERLKNPNNIFGKDYFEEQLERIRDIRSSERRFYQKLTDIYAQCSADYSVNDELTKQFFAAVQNKLHFAITGNTAAEIIYERASSKKKNMGLGTWKNASKGVIRKTDVSIAKNYLDNSELDSLNRIVTMYLDYAELQAKTSKLMFMKDWVQKLDTFLRFNEQEILQHTGKIAAEIAKAFAEGEYDKYHNQLQENIVSDFDKTIENKPDDFENAIKKLTATKKKKL